MKKGWIVAILLVVANQSFAQQHWQKTYSPVCGKILIRDGGRIKAVKKETVQVYRSRNVDVVTCCEQAELLLETKTDRYGNFFIKKLDAGDYFLTLRGSTPMLSIPILVEKAYESKACDIDQRFTVDVATGKSEITAIIEVD